MKPSLPQSLNLELTLDEAANPEGLKRRAAQRLGLLPTELPPLVVRKRSLDCRGGRPRFHYLVECVAGEVAPGLAWGREAGHDLAEPPPRQVRGAPPVVIVGDGPCGLFCAYELARRGVACVVLDRGKPVQPRRKDLKGLTRRGSVDPDSNYCFGEGGAGTYSDGKLYTRAHKRGDVRDVLEVLAVHGAPTDILVDARPHVGSNLLPQIVTAIRRRLEDVGIVFRFGARVVDVCFEPSDGRTMRGVRLDGGEEIEAAAVVLATGHSARDVYQLLDRHGHPLEAKPFAIGVRVEHPQELINRIQYKSAAGHPALPSAAYSVVDSTADAPVFSFCMCPGGFMVPATTEPGAVVVNGMSPSRRNSKYANSGMVVGVHPQQLEEAGLKGPLAGLRLQQHLERVAFEAGGGALRAPATRLTDFMSKRGSATLPACSYVPGCTATDVAQVLDAARVGLAERLRRGFARFGRQLPGYLTGEALVVAVESRTSSPVRVPRCSTTLQSPVWPGLYPGGEGAGYAGGIVSAAVDGIRIARAVATRLGC